MKKTHKDNAMYRQKCALNFTYQETNPVSTTSIMTPIVKFLGGLLGITDILIRKGNTKSCAKVLAQDLMDWKKTRVIITFDCFSWD